MPFDSNAIDRDRLISVIERVSALGFGSVTLGGGDPFQYKFLPCVVKRAKELDLFVHIDTHAVTLSENESNATLVQGSVDLIGLPLDGASCYTHDLMRGYPGHYAIIRSKINWLKLKNANIKLNTMVSSVNRSELNEIGKLVSRLQPGRWSIYQFWPVGPAKKAAHRHYLDEQTFSECVREIDFNALANVTSVEINAAESRRRTYPILNHDGEVYVHHEYPADYFQYIGSIFDAAISSKLDDLCGVERVQAASRYNLGGVRRQERA